MMHLASSGFVQMLLCCAHLNFTSGSTWKIADIFMGVVPKSMEDTRSIFALVRVPSEEVTLSLDQIFGKISATVLVLVCQWAWSWRNSNAIRNS